MLVRQKVINRDSVSEIFSIIRIKFSEIKKKMGTMRRKLFVAIFCIAMINLSTSISTIRADLSEDVANGERTSGKRPGICVMAGCNCTIQSPTVQLVNCKFTENQVKICLCSKLSPSICLMS